MKKGSKTSHHGLNVVGYRRATFSCFVIWEITCVGQTIKLRGLPKAYGTKPSTKVLEWLK